MAMWKRYSVSTSRVWRPHLILFGGLNFLRCANEKCKGKCIQINMYVYKYICIYKYIYFVSTDYFLLNASTSNINEIDETDGVSGGANATETTQYYMSTDGVSMRIP
jgi:hypothetical protein